MQLGYCHSAPTALWLPIGPGAPAAEGPLCPKLYSTKNLNTGASTGGLSRQGQAPWREEAPALLGSGLKRTYGITD
eukprot:CAMPEP_0174331318 /NCGR_PEP_ID=MMETSP0810-20121108/17397_1 /TAXON_ID=73025 ORGANISM="Eutreptiella gymnastica-like, Strain CCMP1594" /NCGR_SAMPLE_ID=MMETSP0810 /ASSEMBLY_ACC=CAM_ASM_000659 /LENGTH=75 /DNA_ID=CAMNT_0015447045 /DNA_START=671 /DNA_END=898 /DNA_ORIENTATION=+